ncbi:MAG: 2'-5' RNA ligase family protein [Acidimicrobiales bacterium]
MTPTAEAADPRLSVWGGLAPADEERLATLIATIAARYGTPTFRPHVTLVGDAGCSSTDIGAKMASIARARAPVTVGLTSVTHSARQFRAVVLECDWGCAELAHLHEALAASLAIPRTRPWRPHVSVVYGELDVVTRREIVGWAEEQLSAPITLSFLALVETTGRDASTWTTRAAQYPFLG